MQFSVYFAKFLAGDVGVDLGGGDVFVTEKFLDHAQVNALTEEVGGKGMAHDMWCCI